MLKNNITLHRWNWVTAIAFVCIGMITTLILTRPGLAQDDLRVIQGNQSNNRWMHYTDAPNALYHHLAGQAFDMLERRSQEIDDLNSRRAWKKRQQWTRETLMDVVGPFPSKTPLNARILRTLDKDGYRVEHLVYESQPKFYVTASMFIPDGLREKAPVVIYCSGHTMEGYRSNTYQHVILNLVKKGFIVFAFDPVGQGERLEYFDPELGRTVMGGTTREHSYAGAQAFLAGSSEAMYMVWDGIRGIDYLLTREEVDPDRIGITGRSGGGTQSSYIAAVDDRVYAAAPECYITNFTRLLQSIGPQDAEQNMYQVIAAGLDHPDLLEVRAPKPALMITTTRDFFSIQGAKETAAEVSRIYEAYGEEENFGMVEDDAPHMSTEKNREAMYAFFQKHLDNPGNVMDEEVELLTEEELRVTSTGQVSTALGSETVFSLNKQDVLKMGSSLEDSRQNLSGHLSGVAEAARELSGYVEPGTVEDPVFTGRFQRDGYVIEKYYVQGEGDYVLPYLLMLPDNPNNKGMVYLHPAGKAADASPGGEMEWFVKQGFTILAPDMVGLGEMGPGGFRGDAYIDGVSFNVWFASMLIGRSIVGVRAGDLVRLTRLLEQRPEVQNGALYGIAKGAMGPVLLHAAAFESSISRIALIEPYASYRALATNYRYNAGFIHGTVPGAIAAYDLPDLAASLAPRKLLMANITDEDGHRVEPDNIDQDLSVIRDAYQAKNAQGQLTIQTWETFETLDNLYDGWLK